MDVSHDELIYLIHQLYPNAVHGKDFWCGHYVEEGSFKRLGSAWIDTWKLDDPEPTADALEALFETHKDALAAMAGEHAQAELLARIDAERDRRINDGFVFDGVAYQSRPEDRENIDGAATAALEAKLGDAKPGDLRWHDDDTDFVWIAKDNSTHAMDAQTMFAFGKAALKHKQAHIFAARAIKDMDPIPDDFTADHHWPDQ